MFGGEIKSNIILPYDNIYIMREAKNNDKNI